MHLRKSGIYLQYTDVLDTEKLDNLLAITKTFRDQFKESGTIDENNSVRPGMKYRKSMVLNTKYFPEYKKYFKELFFTNLPFFCTSLGINEFEMGNIQIQITAHNDGDYYLWHKDKSGENVKNRMITFVYYFNAEPKAFTGGELVIYPPDSLPIILQPEINTMVLFDPVLLHEVKPVSCPGKIFENSRFTLTGWILIKTPENNSSE